MLYCTRHLYWHARVQGLPGIFSACRDWALQSHLHWTCAIPAKVNENCACTHERQDPLVYNEGESFSHLCIITRFEAYCSIFSPKIPCFSPLSQTLNKHMRVGGTPTLLKELNGLPKSRLLLWKQCWINYHSQTEKQRMAGGKKMRKGKKNKPSEEIYTSNAPYKSQQWQVILVSGLQILFANRFCTTTES